MHISQTMGNARKFAVDYYGNRLNTERLTVISPQRRKINLYNKYVKRLKVRQTAVLYESNNGRGMVDNPYALFRALIDQDRYGRLEHYWVVDDANRMDLAAFKHMRNVHFVVYESKGYLRALATCKYLINNATFPYYFFKREGQVYINTWHGTPMKAMGYDMAGGIIGSANIVRNFLSADYLISANDVMSNMYLRSYKMQDICPAVILEEGYPRCDLAISTGREAVVEKLEHLGISVDHSKKIILFAPTWRNAGVTNDRIDISDDAEELLEFKRQLETRVDTNLYQVLVKPHNYLYDLVKDDERLKGELVPSIIDTNELLSAVDILISDYSSIVFDYLMLDRPIVYYLPDIESYRQTRGITYSFDELPGARAASMDELGHIISRIDELWESERERFVSCKARICPYDDGGVAQRVADIVFLGKHDYRHAGVDHSKKKLLFSGGEVVYNGLTRSLMSLLNQVDYDRYDVTVYLRIADESMIPFLDEINPHARVMVRVGALGFTKDEDALRATYDGFGKYNDIVKRTYPRSAFKREARRCFGCVHYDVAIDFNGYEQMLTETILGTDAESKVLWLHNDIKADMNKLVNGEPRNYWRLNHIISTYGEFDHVVSCGKQVMVINRDNFATPETYGKFTYAKNTIDIRRIEKCLAEKTRQIDGIDYYVINDDKMSGALSLIELPKRDRVTFLNIGRFSPEKNHVNLIRAFFLLHEEYPNTELYILGDGPIRPTIESEIANLQAGGFVRIPGNVPNPFIFMSRSDCFILPSLHEGQPLVTLEARACGLPVITGNFSTVQDSLIEGGQLVIDGDVESILGGLRAYMKGDVPTIDFDVQRYNKEAFAEFERAVF